MPDPRSNSIAIPPAAPDSSSSQAEKGSNSRQVATTGGGGHGHPNLKTVLISGFCSAKGTILLLLIRCFF